MSEMFVEYTRTNRVIIGQSPYPDGCNLANIPDFPYNQVAFLRSIPAKWPTEQTVNSIWSLLFDTKKSDVRNLLNDIKDDNATVTREEYLAKYLLEKQKLYLINAFTDKSSGNISNDLKDLRINNDDICKKVLVIGDVALSGIKYLSNSELFFMIHPSPVVANKDIYQEQWCLFNHGGNGKYSSSNEITTEFRLQQK